MEYDVKYVCFLDILGFSNYVSNDDSVEKVSDLFSFVNKYCNLFNTSPNLKTKASFFSDSIVLSSDELGYLMIAIVLAESYLQSNLGLLFRGGMCKGKVYSAEGVTFGPAVVTTYNLEKKAQYSRIIIDESIIKEDIDCLEFYRDIDGNTSFNPYALLIHNGTKYGGDGPSYPDGDPVENVLSIFREERAKILASIEKHKNTTVIDKYLWRIRPFNYTCREIARDSSTIEYLLNKGYIPDESFRARILDTQIQNSDIII